MAEEIKRKGSRVWNTTMVNESIRLINDGVELSDTPFFESDINLRAGDIVFDYTLEEQEIWLRCANDPIYFSKLCQLMTDDGYRTVEMRDYQEDFIRTVHNNKLSICMASRQVGKTTTSAIYIAWYLIFNKDRNVMILSNKGETVIEILDKIKNILNGLPFFLKPGIIRSSVKTMRFDNGCRLLSQSTSKSAAIGFTLHLVYMDEFAHINPSFLEPFYRSVYPTISSSKISKMIITSTPNGMNMFYDLWIAALESKNKFVPIRIDYWLVPGRETDEWKQNEISNIGSEELFNQEYGLQFLKSSSLLLDIQSLKKIKNNATKYVYKELTSVYNIDFDYSDLLWHPKFNPNDIKSTDKFVITVDLSEGKEKDSSVINILKLVPKSLAAIAETKVFDNEKDFFGLLQVGLYKSNKADIELICRIINMLLFDVLDDEQAKLILEMNFRGDLALIKLNENEDFYDEILLHSKHTEKARCLLPGIRLNKQNKPMYCFALRKLVSDNRVIITEADTHLELSAFGLNNKGSYSSQIGHDDIAMTLVNCTVYFESAEFEENVEDIYDDLDPKYKDLITKKFIELQNRESTGNDNFDILKSLL